jgi:hypothetical protein
VRTPSRWYISTIESLPFKAPMPSMLKVTASLSAAQAAWTSARVEHRAKVGCAAMPCVKSAIASSVSLQGTRSKPTLTDR